MSKKPSQKASKEVDDREKRSRAGVVGSASFVMERFGSLEDTDRSFDIEYWQRQGDAAIYRAAWELVEFYHRQHLIVNKRAVGHPQDLVDLSNLLQAKKFPAKPTKKSKPVANKSPKKGRGAKR